MDNRSIILKVTDAPKKFMDVAPTLLTDETLQERKNKVLALMKREGFEALVIYADKEHGGNFEYLTGFIPRFEEGLLILDQTGEASVILGNENLKMAEFSRLPVTLKHSPLFSLPNQAMDNEKPLETLFIESGLETKKKIGLVGWKMFTPTQSNGGKYFDLPYFIVDAIKNSTASDAILENATYLFIRGDIGARTVNNANEIAHYEYGANLASNCILDAMNAVEIGIRESDLGNYLAAEGQYNTVVTIAAAGQRFEKANFYPTHKQVQKGDPLSLTTGFRGGLSSRAGFVISQESELPDNQQDYLDRMAKPYFNAVVSWLENIKVGMTGADMHALIEKVFPQQRYGWHLNPGHLSAEEEWMSSPIYRGSQERLQSGMILQIDIIPSVAGYNGASVEESVVLADESLQQQIKQDYPALWTRMTTRRHYIKNVLNINLSSEILPLSNSVAYWRPFYLAKNQSLCCE